MTLPLAPAAGTSGGARRVVGVPLCRHTSRCGGCCCAAAAAPVLRVGARVTRHHGVLDYIRGGCEISLVVAVDFTASNGDPRQPSSLHYSAPGKPSEYERAIRSVGGVLGEFDSDGRIPAFGFGGAVRGRGVSHLFALNGNEEAPDEGGIDGVVNGAARAVAGGAGQ